MKIANFKIDWLITSDILPFAVNPPSWFHWTYKLGFWHQWPPSPSETTKNYVRCHWSSFELAQVLPHWLYVPIWSSRGLTCPYSCCSKQTYLGVQFLHRFSLRPSFHPSTALPHNLGSINNNMPPTPNCTWKFHLTHPIQVSLTLNRHFYLSHPGSYTWDWPWTQKNQKPYSVAHMHETAPYPALSSTLRVPPSRSQPLSECSVSILT